MEDTDELLIWDKIINSAKTKFDFNNFKSYFEEIDDNFADEILYITISGFANEESEELISAKLFSEFMLLGFMWNKEEINTFLKDKNKVFEIEIYAIQLTSSMYGDGTNINQILIFLDQLLNKQVSK